MVSELEPMVTDPAFVDPTVVTEVVEAGELMSTMVAPFIISVFMAGSAIGVVIVAVSVVMAGREIGVVIVTLPVASFMGE